LENYTGLKKKVYGGGVKSQRIVWDPPFTMENRWDIFRGTQSHCASQNLRNPFKSANPLSTIPPRGL